MSTTTATTNIVGRGEPGGGGAVPGLVCRARRHGGANGGQAAYVFVMGSINEILKSFDLPVVFPEINSCRPRYAGWLTSISEEAEDHGYSPDICGYVKADVAVQLRGGEHPMGRIPRPSLSVLTNACNTYIKWAEIWERMYRTPMFTIDIPGRARPGPRPGRGTPISRPTVGTSRCSCGS